MLKAPFNNLIISVESKYIGNMSSLLKRSAIQQGASVDPVDIVQIVGEVVSIPCDISNQHEYEGFSLKDIRVGDKAIFSHSVIYNFKQTTDPHSDPDYMNMVYYKGKEYFICNIQYVYGVIRDGEIIMVNGYTMISDFEDPKIILETKMKKSLRTRSSMLLYIGNPKGGSPTLDTSPGDTVLFNPAKTTRYQINNKPFRILPQNHILGVVTGQVE